MTDKTEIFVKIGKNFEGEDEQIYYTTIKKKKSKWMCSSMDVEKVVKETKKQKDKEP